MLLILFWGLMAVILGGAALLDGLWRRPGTRCDTGETRGWFSVLAGGIFLCMGIFVLRVAVLRWSGQRIGWLLASLAVVFVAMSVSMWMRQGRPWSSAHLRTSSGTQEEIRRSNWWLRSVVLLAGIGMIATGIYLGNRPVRYELAALKASGTVITHRQSTGITNDNDGDAHERVRFTTANGAIIIFEDQESRTEFGDVGESVRVLYFADHPEAAIIDRGLWILLVDAAIVMFGMLSIGVGIGPLI
jgi:hypothetical protein